MKFNESQTHDDRWILKSAISNYIENTAFYFMEDSSDLENKTNEEVGEKKVHKISFLYIHLRLCNLIFFAK